MNHPLFVPRQSWRKDMSQSFVNRWWSLMTLSVAAAILRVLIDYCISEKWDLLSRLYIKLPDDLRELVSTYASNGSSIGYNDTLFAVLALLFAVSIALMFENNAESSSGRASDYFSQLLVYATCGAAFIGGLGFPSVVFSSEDWFVGICILVAYNVLLAWLLTYGLQQHVRLSSLRDNVSNRVKKARRYRQLKDKNSFLRKHKIFAVLCVFTVCVVLVLFWGILCCELLIKQRNILVSVFDSMWPTFLTVSLFQSFVTCFIVDEFGESFMLFFPIVFGNLMERVEFFRRKIHHSAKSTKMNQQLEKLSWVESFEAVSGLILYCLISLTSSLLCVVFCFYRIADFDNSVFAISGLAWMVFLLLCVSSSVFVLFVAYKFLIFYRIQRLGKSVQMLQRIIERQHYEVFMDSIVHIDRLNSQVDCYLDMLYKCLIPLSDKVDALSDGYWGWVEICYQKEIDVVESEQSEVCYVPLLSLSSDELNKWFDARGVGFDECGRCLVLCETCKLSSKDDEGTYADISAYEKKVAFSVFCHYLYVLFDNRAYLSIGYPEVPDRQNNQRSRGFGCVIPQLLRDVVCGLFSR